MPAMSQTRRTFVDARIVVAALSTSLMIRQALRRHKDLRALLAIVDAKAIRRRPRRCWGEPARVAVAVRWWFRFDDRSCVGRSLTTYAILRRQGLVPRFVSGVALISSSTTRLDGHAWVELDGSPLDPSDRAAPTRYREILRHPALSSGGDRSNRPV